VSTCEGNKVQKKGNLYHLGNDDNNKTVIITNIKVIIIIIIIIIISGNSLEARKQNTCIYKDTIYVMRNVKVMIIKSIY
jgi:hypothetical protein